MMNTDIERYMAHIMLPEIGLLGQKKLQQASVLCVGAGGLACTALSYLAGAGLGKIGVADGDKIALSNLPRQILFQSSEIGFLKSTTIINRLRQLNHEVVWQDFPTFITEGNAKDLFAKYDYILDATDNFTAKLLLNDVCHALQKPLISANVGAFQGECSIFWYPYSGCWRCLYPELAKAKGPSCSAAGVLGIVPGLFGLLQAWEMIKLCLNLPQALIGKQLRWDLLQGSPKIYSIPANPDCLLCRHPSF